MRVRTVDPSRRTVGFGATKSERREAEKIRRTQGMRRAGSARTSMQSASRQNRQAIRQKPRQKVAELEDFDRFTSTILGEDDYAADKEELRAKANSDFLTPVSTLEFDLSSKDLKPDYSLKKRDLSEKPSLKKGRLKNKKVKKSHKFRNVAIAVLAILVVSAGALAIWGNSLISKLTGGNSGLIEFIGAIGSNVDLKTDKNGRANVLIFGTSGFDMEGTDGDYAHDGAQLTDSIMLLSVDQENNDVAMVSLPRDLYVGNTCTATGKVNEVYYCSNLYGDDEKSGAEALQNTISEIFDMDIQYWVHVNWGALMELVDGVGGITVTLDEDIEDDWTGTYIKAGEPVTLDGWHAVALARARHGTAAGDFTRGASQQKILAALQKKIMEGGVDLGTVLKLVDVIGDNVRMNFSLEELKSVFYLAKETSMDSVRQIPLVDYANGIYYLSTAMMNGISYVVPAAGTRDYSKIQEYVHQMTSSNPATREDANILVLNGSGVNGLAATEQDKLEKVGFKNVEVGDAPAGEYKEKYSLYHLTEGKTGSLIILKEELVTEPHPAEELPAGINADGYDFVIILGGTQNDKTD